MFPQAMPIHKFCMNLPEVWDKSLRNSLAHVGMCFFYWLTPGKVLRNLSGTQFLLTSQVGCREGIKLVAEAYHTGNSPSQEY